MPRDPQVELASEKLTYVYSRAQKLTGEWFPDTKSDPMARRIACIAVMKMLVQLMDMGIRRQKLEDNPDPR
ncbi:MAG: hypothetical protein ACE5Z5_12870 [Candidatus Bathyarchaeia archaeon]